MIIRVYQHENNLNCIYYNRFSKRQYVSSLKNQDRQALSTVFEIVLIPGRTADDISPFCVAIL